MNISSLSQRLILHTMITFQTALHPSNSDMSSSLIWISSFNQRLILEPKDLPEEIADIEFGHVLILQNIASFICIPSFSRWPSRGHCRHRIQTWSLCRSQTPAIRMSHDTHTHTWVRYATRTSDVIYISLKLPPFDQTECRAFIRDSFMNTQSSIHLICAVVAAHSNLHTHTLIRDSFVTHS